jgi:hypothetical protein
VIFGQNHSSLAKESASDRFSWPCDGGIKILTDLIDAPTVHRTSPVAGAISGRRYTSSGDELITTECLHARPEPGSEISPCCGRTLAQLPQYERITLDPQLVTCGRLSNAEVLLLSGQPVVTDPANEQVVFSMALAVCSLSSGAVPLGSALDSVNLAIRELLPPGKTLTLWSAPLMAQVTTRAQELISK